MSRRVTRFLTDQLSPTSSLPVYPTIIVDIGRHRRQRTSLRRISCTVLLGPFLDNVMRKLPTSRITSP